MINLDNLKAIKRYDCQNMLELLESFDEQCLAAKRIGMDFKLPAGWKSRYSNIVFTGLGGSAIGADILRSYLSDEISLPIFVNRNYTLPEFIDEKTLVVAASYSGNTEEVLSAYKNARSKKAKLFVTTSGGQLQMLAKLDKTPAIIIPKGLPPRCALGYAFFPILILLSKLGLIEYKSKKIDEAIKVMSEIKARIAGHRIPESKNIAKAIARKMYLKYPVIYGNQDHIDSVVARWRAQLAENAKTLSSSHLLPEMNHNEIVGWEHPEKILRNFVVILLRDTGDQPRIVKRMNIAKSIIEKQGTRVIEVHSRGRDLLSRIFSLIYLGDFVSYYLAILNKADPTPVDRIAYLKKELSSI